MKINLPIKFTPNFCDDKNYYYQKSGVARDNLISALMEASNNYCMYTFDSIMCGTEEFIGDVEHSIEKSEYKGSEINPFNCKFNLSASTRIANIKYKKGIKSVIEGVKFECDKKYSCKKACKPLIQAHVDSVGKNKYFLMPNTFTSKLGLTECDLEFCLTTLAFKASRDDTVFSEILSNHIDVFKLNENKYIHEEIIQICKGIIECGFLLPSLDDKVPTNYTTELFIQFLRKLSKKKCVSIASLIIKNSKIYLPAKKKTPSPKLQASQKKHSVVSESCTYLTPESYGVAKRRFIDKVIIEEYHGVIYPFIKR